MKKPIKSLLISGREFPPLRGGIARFMWDIVSGLGPAEISCLTGVPADVSIEAPRSNAGLPRIYRRPAAFASGRFQHALGLGTAMSEILMRERPAVAQISTAFDGNVALWLRKWFGIPYMIYAHGNEILDAQTSDWPKPKLSLIDADSVAAVSHFTAALLTRIGVPAEKIEVIRPACDAERFKPRVANQNLKQRLLGSRSQDRVILSLGRLVPRKGNDMVIKALPQLLRQMPDLSYLMVGEGPFRQRLEELAYELGVRANVFFAGEVAEDLLPEFYALSDVFVMTSRNIEETCDVEGFGIVYLEAAASAKPVVAGNAGGAPEAIQDGITGLLVDPLCHEDLARALMQILGSEEAAQKMGSSGRERVIRDFTMQGLIRQVRQCVNRLAERGKEPS